ncbi:uncharacterized protein [Nicotiana sylvestris]|uniref:uncharacterized protein n=1 Tax=Nicotiana sylvestris TaxID=4096 RepID=UPI00388C91F6
MEHKEFPIKYLGCPLYVGWHTKFLSTSGRAILIRHVLLALPVHLLAAIHPPKGVLNQIERMLARFFWGNSEEKKRFHWASWDKLCMPYAEGGDNFRKLQRSHPLIKQWYSGNSHSLNAMCKIKREVDMHILWKIGKGDIAFWFDNWTNLGPLCNFLPEGRNPRNIMLSDVIVNDQSWWGGWDCLLPDHVMGTIEAMQIRLRPSVQDTLVWTVNEKGVFSVASTWNIFRKVKRQSWIDSKTWQKQVPFKMCFTVWRALRDRLPTDARNISRIMCGAKGIPFTRVSFRMLLVNWWKTKTKNPVEAYLINCLPIVTAWKIWKARCGVKYGSERLNVRRTTSLICFSILQIINSQFPKFNTKPIWSSICHLFNINIGFKKTIITKWNKPPAFFVKLNSDGSCKNGLCGGGGVIRDNLGCLIVAFTII